METLQNAAVLALALLVLLAALAFVDHWRERNRAKEHPESDLR